jgi:hypothetical protein
MDILQKNINTLLAFQKANSVSGIVGWIGVGHPTYPSSHT